MALLAGREIHPINVRVGGFYKAPTVKSLQSLRADLEKAREQAIALVKWTAALPIPPFDRQPDQDYEFVALVHPDEYPMNEGRIVSSAGLDIAVNQYDDYFVESHAPYTTALQSDIRERGAYLVGPMARYNLNFDRLTPLTRQIARETGFDRTCTNPFESIVIRSLEVLHACDEALKIIDNYQVPDQSYHSVTPVTATGYAATEAPRGLLYHRYSIDDEGLITDAQIVPPTSQNQKTIEADLHQLVVTHMALPDPDLRSLCEQSIRNYDPCISCATHFLTLHRNKVD